MKFNKIIITLLLAISIVLGINGCGNNDTKSVELTSSNCENYLDITVNTTSDRKTMNIIITSRSSAYIFSNCILDIKPVGHSFDTLDQLRNARIYVDSNGKGRGSVTLSSGAIRSYKIDSVSGTVSKNPLS